MAAKITPNNQEHNRAVMKKSQRANLATMEIRNIRTFDYDVQSIYTLGPPSSKRSLEGSNPKELNLQQSVKSPFNPIDLVKSISWHRRIPLCEFFT